MKDNIDLIKRLNKTIVHDDGTFDSFEKQLLNLSGGIFDVTKPLIVSSNSSSISYFEESVDKPITMRVNTALKIREKHEIGYAFVGQCLDLLRGSVLAFESLTQENSMVVLLDDFNVDNDPYIAICRMDRLMNAVEVNEITSVYDKQNFEKFLIRSYDAGKRFYKNKKTEQYIKSQRLQLPKEMIFALSDNYYNHSFTKSQVEANIESNNISSVKPSLSSQIQFASARTAETRSTSDVKLKAPEPEHIILTGQDIKADDIYKDMDFWDDDHVYLRLECLNNLGKRFDDLLKSEQAGPEDLENVTETTFYALFDLRTKECNIQCDYKYFEVGYSLEDTVHISLTTDEQRLVFDVMNEFCIKEKGHVGLMEYIEAAFGSAKSSIDEQIQTASARATESHSTSQAKSREPEPEL